MYRNTGNFTFATIDYYYENIFGRLDDPNMPKMTALIDPYEYRERFVMPKLIISSTGDEFFMPDDRNGCTSTLERALYCTLKCTIKCTLWRTLYISTFIKSHYYFQDLPEPKYLRLLANAEHSTVLNGLSNPHFIFSLRSLFVATIKGKYESYNMTSLPFRYNVI